jgi:hypothetical protein
LHNNQVALGDSRSGTIGFADGSEAARQFNWWEILFDQLAAENPTPKSQATLEASEHFIDSNIRPLWLQNCNIRRKSSSNATSVEHQESTFTILVPENGLEPSRSCGHRILSPARLPLRGATLEQAKDGSKLLSVSATATMT